MDPLPGSSAHGDSPGKNTGVGCRALLQGIFPTQRLDSSLPHLQADSLLSEPRGKPNLRVLPFNHLLFQLCPTFCDPMDCSTPDFPVLHRLQELFRFMSTESVMPSNDLILCCPLLLLPSIFPSFRVFSSEPALHISWPNY